MFELSWSLGSRRRSESAAAYIKAGQCLKSVLRAQFVIIFICFVVVIHYLRALIAGMIILSLLAIPFWSFW